MGNLQIINLPGHKPALLGGSKAARFNWLRNMTGRCQKVKLQTVLTSPLMGVGDYLYLQPWGMRDPDDLKVLFVNPLSPPPPDPLVLQIPVPAVWNLATAQATLEAIQPWLASKGVHSSYDRLGLGPSTGPCLLLCQCEATWNGENSPLTVIDYFTEIGTRREQLGAPLVVAGVRLGEALGLQAAANWIPTAQPVRLTAPLFDPWQYRW